MKITEQPDPLVGFGKKDAAFFKLASLLQHAFVVRKSNAFVFKNKPHKKFLNSAVFCFRELALFSGEGATFCKHASLLFTKNASVCLHHSFRKSLKRLLKVCYVPATSKVIIAFFSSFLLQPLTVLMKQTRQPVCAI